MSYVNVGAVDHIDGSRYASKAALKRALTSDAATVSFGQTSAFPSSYPSYFTGSEIPAGVTLSVVGPDPYGDRRWYASVSVSATGKLVVK